MTPITDTTTTTDGGDEVAVAPDTEPVVSIGPIGVRGGPLLGVGLAALGLLALLVEGDRRKMRRAQRTAPTAMGDV